jgi:MFS family permease
MPVAAPTPASSAPQRVRTLINAAHSLTHYSLLILPTAVLSMVSRTGGFGTDYGPILQLATGGFILYGLFSLPQGWLAARLGRHALMAIFWLGTGACLALTGLAHTPLQLGAALAGAGLFAAIYHPVGTAMLVDLAGDKPGRALGVNGVFGNLGTSTAPMLTAILAGVLGWRWTFVLPGLACIALGLVWLRTPSVDGHHRAAMRPFPPIPPRLVRRAVTVLLLIAAVSGLVFNTFTILVPKLMQDRLIDRPDMLWVAGVAATAATLCGALTQLTVGRMMDRITLKRVFLPLALILVPALVALAFARGLALVVMAGLVAVAIFGQVTVNETMTARYISPQLRTRMYSLRFFVGFLGSAAAAPMVSVLHERSGNLVSAILVLAGFAVVTLLCAVFFPDRREELHPELWALADARPAPAE